MADNVSISTPVEIVPDSKSRVAFDLAVKIGGSIAERDNARDRTYWLTLYRQCYKAAHGHDLDSILKQV